ncbi:MAG: LamG domain-containing protein [Candidatus Aenigmatarchaeota archaeon]
MVKIKGISPLVGFVMVLGISIFMTTIALTVIKPTIEKNKAINLINEASLNLEMLYSTIKDVVQEAPGSKRTISITISDGYYYLDKNKNCLIFRYDSPQRIDLLGKIGDKFLSLGTIFYDFFVNDNLTNYKIISGNWNIINGRLEGINGTIYIPINGTYNSVFISSRFSSETDLAQLFVDPTPENLVLYLTFDEGNGNIAYDYSGNNNHGILYNGSIICSGLDCPNWVDGKFGKAIQFDGINDYVEIPHNNVFNSFNLTIALWLYRYSANNYESWRGIVSKGWKSGFGLYTLSIYYLGFYMKKPDFSWEMRSYNLGKVDEWIHLVVTWDGTNLNWYENGVLRKTESLPGYSIEVGSSPINIARDPIETYRTSQIKVDEVKIYNRTLSELEIKFLYEQGLKKLRNSGMIYVNNFNNSKIVFSNPVGKTYFSEIIIGNLNSKEIELLLPIYNVEFSSGFKISKGNYKIKIENVGFNESNKRSILKISLE